MYVLDCSVAMTWCFDDEASEATDALLDRLATTEAVVPLLWFWEVSSVMTLALRRGRLTRQEVTARLAMLDALPIVGDTESTGRAWRETRLLAESERLTVYDAAYLELAMRRRLPLATLDGDLRAAALRVGATLLL